MKKSSNLVTVPQGTSHDFNNNPVQGNVVGVNNPAVTPDGAGVFTLGDNLATFKNGLPVALTGVPGLFRFAFQKRK